MKFLVVIGTFLLPFVNTREYNRTHVEEALKQTLVSGAKDLLRTAGDLVFGEDAYTHPDPGSGVPLPAPTGLKTPSMEDATYYIHFAAAAYCEGAPLADWSCQECKLVRPSVQMVKVLTNETRGTQAFIVHDDSKKEFILVFRGSHNLPNIMDDFNWEFVPTQYKDGAKIHNGFNLAVMSLYKNILAELTDLLAKNTGYRVVITGHSLGGSMADLTYYNLNHDLSGKNFSVFTYGQPRVGYKAFADYINSQSIPFARVTNEADLAPQLIPSSLGFLHHGTEFWTHGGTTRVCSNNLYEDPTCFNSELKEKLNTDDHQLYLGTKILMQCV